MEPNNGWNPELEHLIAEIEEKSWAYTWLHNSSVNYLGKWNDRLSVAGIGIDIATGTSTFATLNTCTKLFWLQLSTGIIIYAGAFIGGYMHYHRLAEKIEKHKFSASRYSSLYHSIQRERGLKPEQRQNAKDYITWVTNQYDSLLLTSPEIDDYIIKKYFLQYRDKKTSHPVMWSNVKPDGSIVEIDVTENLIKDNKSKSNVVVAINDAGATGDSPPTATVTATVTAPQIKVTDKIQERIQDSKKDTFNTFKYDLHNRCSDTMMAYQLNRLNTDDETYNKPLWKKHKKK
jgi:hypothetical protein